MSFGLRSGINVSFDLAEFYVWISLRRHSSLETSRGEVALGLPLLGRAAVLTPLCVIAPDGTRFRGMLTFLPGRRGALPSMTFELRGQTAMAERELGPLADALLAEIAAAVSIRETDHAA